MPAEKLTKAQRRVIEHVAANPRLYGAMFDFRGHRRDVVRRVCAAGFISPPRVNEPPCWAVTPAGRAALQQDQTDGR